MIVLQYYLLGLFYEKYINLLFELKINLKTIMTEFLYWYLDY